ncbi:hypothetical protein [Tenggerimyces flavus]|uniref:DUF1835 domain-containing protein n=1 Tax=Tenggerimyces flavus TaxID=1708749 RepID=A0ABV7YEM3_9ACTN|nr:hypothetical protein [Tenggerimyces flavus]MBM7786848.1 hypothetical protein [Tenggerimyces flavus]
MTKDASFKQRVRARMERTGESYSTARSHLDQHRAQLHVTNGDATVSALRAAGFDEPILPWRDILHDGPVPGGLDDAALRQVRARFLAEESFGDYERVLADLAARDHRLAQNVGGTFTLWFESDLYDQLQIVEILRRLALLGCDPANVTIMTASATPGEFAHDPDLRSRQPTRQTISAETLELAAAAWAAFTSDDPSGLGEIARTSSYELPFLADAFGRLLQEYPAVSDGLSVTERRLLLGVEAGASTAGEAFVEMQRREKRPFLGDWPCYERLVTLASGATPLLALGGDDLAASAEGFHRRRVELTDVGRDVLAERADHVALNGIDRWIGGVHLQGTTAAWRYDDRRETLVAS